MSSRSWVVVLVVVGVAGCGEVKSYVDAGDVPDTCTNGVQDGDETGLDCGGSCTPCVACAAPGDCPSGICEAQVCVNAQQVPCADAAPANATSSITDVTITYSEASGWSTPAACAWACDRGFCPRGDACGPDLADVTFDPGPVGSRWFGGDDRDLDGNGTPDVRSVGAGQSLIVESAIAMSHFGFYLTSPFHSAAGGGEFATTVNLELRNPNGGIIASSTTVVPASFQGGWVYWALPQNLAVGTQYLFTAYVPGVWSGQNYTSGIRTHFADGYGRGTAYVKELRVQGDMQPWAGWNVDQGSDYAWRIVADDGCPLP
jgi:hypothetical protein